jgi:hypothetical protein
LPSVFTSPKDAHLIRGLSTGFADWLKSVFPSFGSNLVVPILGGQKQRPLEAIGKGKALRQSVQLAAKSTALHKKMDLLSYGNQNMSCACSQKLKKKKTIFCF